MEELIQTKPNGSDSAVNTIPYLVGSNGIMGVVLLYLIKRWINGMFVKLARIETIQSDLLKINLKLEHMGEQIAELRYPIGRIAELDKDFAVMTTKVNAVHRRLDSILKV